MTTNNSLVGFNSALLQLMITDVADCYASDPCIHKSLLRDREEIRNRVNSQGMSFLTKDLPRLGKAVDTALGNNTPFECPEGFKTRKDSKIPELFGSLLSVLFDKDGLPDRKPLNKADRCQAVYYIRQLLYVMYKLRLPYEENDVQKVINSFVQTDASLATSDNAGAMDTFDIVDGARNLATTVFGNLPFREITPRHGPGSVATGENTCDKSYLKRIYRKLEQVYPYTEYMMFNLNHVCDDYKRIQRLTELESGTAKVVLVPKDSRGPRLISSEPLEYQWIQQGLADLIVRRIESYKLTKGRVNFTDQGINRELALAGSRTGKWVTLDMKEASDRVSLKLVETIFRDCPMLAGLLAARSTHTKLPNGDIMELKKFAPMGSALCFPVEAFIFWALTVSVIRKYYGYTLKQACSMVFVYGDDIITTAEVYGEVMQQLPQLGLMFNVAKCCTAGFFRESCGCEAYEGFDVTPVRLRTVYVSELTYEPSDLLGFVAFHNAMYLRGYYRMCDYLAKYLEETWGFIPRTYPNTGTIVGWTNHSVVTYDVERETAIHGRTVDAEYAVATLCSWNASRHSSIETHPGAFRIHKKVRKHFPAGLCVNVWTVISKPEITPYDGYAEMLRRTCCGNWLTGPRYSPRRGAGLYRRWMPWTKVRGI